ncbi:MAG: bifunctional glycosyltransferase family 2/GtrA family protein [Lachnospiraceae bacterium]|nr:bifunctional glycosyltransferase family 2/GtrA family protein [Lachnospiraceae bacterium]
MDRSIPILIPAYEPDERMLGLLETLIPTGCYVVIVDDGSGVEYASLFEKASEMLGENGHVLHHEVNKGKGRALKTGFSYILENMPEASGVVTADSDGQHVAEAISEVSDTLKENPECLIMGVRSFDREDIPWKSSFGNKITIKVMSFVTGIKTSDTQTGLRGIPRSFMEKLLKVRGERFEFEMEMLVESAGKYKIIEVSIPTIYDSKESHQTHFRPVRDSIKIYKVFGRKILKFIISSLSSAVLDILLFMLFCNLLKDKSPVWYVTISTVAARIISATYNYLINYIFVFKSEENMGKAAVKYATLACCQMGLSAGATTLIFWLTHGNETVIKLIVDTVLFIISYKIQQSSVFAKKHS